MTMSRRIRTECGCSALAMREKASYVLRSTAWLSIVLALRFPFLATILVVLLGRLFIAMPVFMLWFMVSVLATLLVCACCNSEREKDWRATNKVCRRPEPAKAIARGSASPLNGWPRFVLLKITFPRCVSLSCRHRSPNLM